MGDGHIRAGIGPGHEEKPDVIAEGSSGERDVGIGGELIRGDIVPILEMDAQSQGNRLGLTIGVMDDVASGIPRAFAPPGGVGEMKPLARSLDLDVFDGVGIDRGAQACSQFGAI